MELVIVADTPAGGALIADATAQLAKADATARLAKAVAATVVVNEAAASRPKPADRFRHTFADRPAWQGP